MACALSLIACVEAEFSGRILIGPDDHARWIDDPNGLTWAVLGVSGLDSWMRTPADRDRLPALVNRGVRVFRLAPQVDEAGALDILRILFDAAEGGLRLAVELPAGNAPVFSRIIAWFEADSQRSERLLPILTGGLPETLGAENLRAFRALGGTIGLPVGRPQVSSLDQFRRSVEAIAVVPYQGRPGYEGIAIATDFLEAEETVPELRNAEFLVKWLSRAFSEPEAMALIEGNGRSFVERLTTAKSPLSTSG